MEGFSRSIQSRRQTFPDNNISKAQIAMNRMLEMERRRNAIRQAHEKEENNQMKINDSLTVESHHDDK